MEDGWSARRGKSDTAKARKIRKSRKLEQHRIHARWTFNDPNPKHMIANITPEEHDKVNQEQTCGRISI